MSRVVLDCSAAVNIVRQTEEGLLLASLIGMAEVQEVVAPQLFYAEVASAFSKYYRVGTMDHEGATARAEQSVRLVNRFVPLDELAAEALGESLRLGHSVYDMFYFVLARRLDAILLTGDRRLRALCEKNGVRCSLRYRLRDGADLRDEGAWKKA